MAETLLGSFPNLLEAEMTAELLRRDGISSLLKPQGCGFASHFFALNFYELWVVAEDLDRALELLEGQTITEHAPPEKSWIRTAGFLAPFIWGA
ncbi:MAG TPA: DUF2007 domain-containing protein [Chloroflexota bacterium]